jgi:hypothetical protein
MSIASATASAEGTVTVEWKSLQDGQTPTRLYDVYRQDGPYTGTGTWTQFAANVAPAGSTTAVEDDASGVTQRFYRVTIAGHTNDVATPEIVGVQELVLDEGANYIALSTLPGTNTLLSVFGTNQLPQGASESTATTVDIWNQTSQAFLVNNDRYWLAMGAGGWKQHNTLATSNGALLDPTKGLIVTIRAGQGAQVVYLTGFVPTSEEVQTVQDNGYTVAASTYPAPVSLEASGLAASGFTGGTSMSKSDNLLFYNPATQLFDIRVWLYSGNGTWRDSSGNPTTRQLQPGEAFLIQRRSRGSNFIWTNPVPYAVPLQGP